MAVAHLDIIETTEAGPATPSAQIDAAAQIMRRVVTDLDPSDLDAKAALALLATLTRLRSSVDAATALVAGRVEACKAHASTGHRSTAHYLAAKAGTTLTRANEIVETGKHVTDHAATAAALRSGAVSVEQAHAVTRAAAVDPSAEADLLSRARTESVRRLAERARNIRLAADDDRLGRYRRQHAARSLRHGTTDEGMVWGHFQLPPDSGAIVVNTLEREADRILRARRAGGDHEAHDRYLADALCTLVTGDPSPDDPPARATRTGGNADVVVHVSVEALRRGRVDPSRNGDADTHEICMIEGVGPIPVEIAREIARDAFLTGVLVDGTDVTRIKRFGRRRSVELRQALEVRQVLTDGDVRCAVDGCDATLGLEVDHIHPIARGGATTYDNQQFLCRHHHRQESARDLTDRAPP